MSLRDRTELTPALAGKPLNLKHCSCCNLTVIIVASPLLRPFADAVADVDVDVDDDDAVAVVSISSAAHVASREMCVSKAPLGSASYSAGPGIMARADEGEMECGRYMDATDNDDDDEEEEKEEKEGEVEEEEGEEEGGGSEGGDA